MDINYSLMRTGIPWFEWTGHEQIFQIADVYISVYVCGANPFVRFVYRIWSILRAGLWKCQLTIGPPVANSIYFSYILNMFYDMITGHWHGTRDQNQSSFASGLKFLLILKCVIMHNCWEFSVALCVMIDKSACMLMYNQVDLPMPVKDQRNKSYM